MSCFASNHYGPVCPYNNARASLWEDVNTLCSFVSACWFTLWARVFSTSILENLSIESKIGEVDSEIDSTIGVRQGSCEDPVLFLFIMQAAMETLEWPEGVSKPEFMTREYGKTTGERASRVRDASSFELWTSLF
jgi:hypothetical protein